MAACVPASAYTGFLSNVPINAESSRSASRACLSFFRCINATEVNNRKTTANGAMHFLTNGPSSEMKNAMSNNPGNVSISRYLGVPPGRRTYEVSDVLPKLRYKNNVMNQSDTAVASFLLKTATYTNAIKRKTVKKPKWTLVSIRYGTWINSLSISLNPV